MVPPGGQIPEKPIHKTESCSNIVKCKKAYNVNNIAKKIIIQQNKNY